MSEPAPPRTPGEAPAAGSGQPDPLWLRLAGLAVACVAALLLALLGAFLTPLRFGTVLVPLSLLLVVGGLVGILWFAKIATDHVGLSLVPGIVWLLISLILSSRTTEGDLVLTQQNWVGSVYLLLGSVTIGVVAYRMIVPPRR
jgi:hypothetical protein